MALSLRHCRHLEAKLGDFGTYMKEQEESCPSSLQLVAGISWLGPHITWGISSCFSVVRETLVANVGE